MGNEMCRISSFQAGKTITNKWGTTNQLLSHNTSKNPTETSTVFDEVTLYVQACVRIIHSTAAERSRTVSNIENVLEISIRSSTEPTE